MAQAPSGQFTNAVMLSLWDFSGSYVLSNEWNTVSLELVHQANGKVSGVRTETYSASGISFQASASDNGRVTSSPKGAGFVTSWKETALATAAAGSFEVTKSARGKWTVVPGLLALQNEGICRTCVGRHCDSKTAVYQVSLPAGMTGTWNLELTLQAQGNKLTGNAVVALSNGRTLNYTLSGRFNPRTQVSTLHLIGTAETRGTSMVTTFAGPQLQLKTLTGSVLGQRLKYP
jgi:DnaJ-class molecular chaperone